MEQIAEPDIDSYLAHFSGRTRELLDEIRRIIGSEAPQAREKISYQMPTYDLYGNLVHFAGYGGHIGFYPGANGIAAFKVEIEAYKNAKGSVQFPLDKPLPEDLIRRIVRFRIAENTAREAERIARKKKRKA
jgi:uncharacterized protein YdhG (YjbR/CyaY superfamily)